MSLIISLSRMMYEVFLGNLLFENAYYPGFARLCGIAVTFYFVMVYY